MGTVHPASLIPSCESIPRTSYGSMLQGVQCSPRHVPLWAEPQPHTLDNPQH